MILFNSNHIFVTYLKELLASYNLPKYFVYTKEDARFVADPKNLKAESPRIIESIGPYTNDPELYATWQCNYLRGNDIQQYRRICTNGKPQWVWTSIPQDDFFVGKRDLTHSKQLLLKTVQYDFYTHKYLGDFLRFKRDYFGINLMPLYNCFTDTLVSKLNIKIKQQSTTSNQILSTFSTLDKKYKIYYIPVKLFQNYTLAIDSPTGFEVCCSLFNEDTILNTEITDTLHALTYKKFQRTLFHQPLLYTGLSELYSTKEEDTIGCGRTMNKILYQLETLSTKKNSLNLLQMLDNLVMLLKVPANVQSTISILEGNYLNYNQERFEPDLDLLAGSEEDQKRYKDSDFRLVEHENKWVTNYEVQYKPKPGYNSPCVDNPSYGTTKIDLTEKPFEPYTHLQLLEYNSKRSYPFANRLIEYLLENVISPETQELYDNIKRVQAVLSLQNTGYKSKTSGVWDEEIRRRLYDYMHSQYVINKTTAAARRDGLGYCDKDVENWLVARNAAGELLEGLSTIDIYNGEN